MNRHPYWLPLTVYRWLEADRRRWWLLIPAAAALTVAGQLMRSST